MYREITKKILFVLFAIGLNQAHAQQWLGRTTSNYSGTYGLYNNASNIADSKYRYYFNFWGRGVNFYNNAFTYNAPIKLNQWANNTYNPDYQTFDGNVDYQKDWLLLNTDGKSKYFSFNQDIWGPSFLFPISRRWNMSINTRQRNGLQMFGLSEELASYAYNKLDSGNRAVQKDKFGINVQSYQELSFTLGGILAKNRKNELNGGITVKFLRGLGAAYLKGENFNFNATSSNSATFNGDIEYAYTDHNTVIAPFNNPYGLFSLSSRGFGAGFDLGLNYQYTSNPDKYKSARCDNNDKRSNYDIKLAFGVNDIGGLRYNRRSNVYTYSSGSNTTVNAPNTILDPFKSPKQNGFDTIGTKVFANMGATKSFGFNTSLPTAINFMADFRMNKYFYLGLFLNQNLKGNNSSGLRSTSMLSLIPRIESRGFEFSMPLTLSENYKNFYIGAYTRVGPVFFGSDNLGGLLSVASTEGQFTGADIYGGVSFGIGHCNKIWYDDKVDPVYIDSVRTDTTRLVERDSFIVDKKDTIIQRDTVEIIKKDTVFINEKPNNKYYIEKEAELKRREAELNKRKSQLDTRESDIKRRENNVNLNNNDELNKCRNQYAILETENRRLTNRVSELEYEITKLKQPTEKINDPAVYLKQRAIDSLIVLLKYNKDELEKCRTSANLNMNEQLKKAEKDRYDAELRALAAKKRGDSLMMVLIDRNKQLDICKKNSSKYSPEIISKLEFDKTKAEREAIAAKRRADSLNLILIQRTNELDICKKSNVGVDQFVVKRLETNIAANKKTIDSLNLVLAQRNKELDNCRKSSVGVNSDALKDIENAKKKAEAEAAAAKKQIDSLKLVVNEKNKALEECKKNNTSSSSDCDEKLKKSEENNTLLKAEMVEMSKTIGRLNTRNSQLSYRVDSLMNELKNCCAKCTGSGNNSELEKLLNECKTNNTQLNAEIKRLNTIIGLKNKSLDSFGNVVTQLNKNQTTLNAQITKLESEIKTLKASGSNCDELQKQLDAKNEELKKSKDDNNKLQNQINLLNNQMNEYKTEYSFMVKQNQKCNAQLDSCKKGLYNTEPSKNEGSIEKKDDRLGQTETDSMLDVVLREPTEEKKASKAGLGFQILGAILDAAVESKTDNNKSKSSKTGSSTNTGSANKTNTETARKTGTASTGTQTNESTSGRSTGNSGNNSGSSSSGSSSSNQEPVKTTGGVSSPNADRSTEGSSGSSRRR